MSQPSVTHRIFEWLPPAWTLGLLLLFFIVANIVIAGIGYLFGISDECLEIIAFPIAEELLKLWLVLRVPNRAFSVIVMFGVIELSLIKAPTYFMDQGAVSLLDAMIASIIVLGFHVSTALAYRHVIDARLAYMIFGTFAVLHVLFNSLSLFDLSTPVWSASAFSICALVVGISWLIVFISTQTKDADF